MLGDSSAKTPYVVSKEGLSREVSVRYVNQKNFSLPRLDL